MVAVLEQLDSQVPAALKGDRQARSLVQAQVQELRALMNAAGGRKLLERWRDSGLTDFNMAVNNAITHYEAFSLVRIPDDTNPYAGQAREAARNEADAARRRGDEARRLYRRLK
jgi:hypothetical protein